MMPWSEQDVARLRELALPDLTDKRVLDLDCGSGFFCAYATYANASYVCGWSTDADAIAKAQKLLPECHFSCRDWRDLVLDSPEEQADERYDIIIVPYPIHHGKALANNLEKLMSHLAPWGTLVLEIMVVKGEKEKGLFKVGKLPHLFPSLEHLHEALAPYTYRYVHQGDTSVGPLSRDVYHVFWTKPEALLFLGQPYSGKSHITNKLATMDFPRLHGDYLVRDIQHGTAWAPERLTSLLQKASDIKNFYILIWMICQSGLIDELVDAILHKAEGKPFIFDGFIPEMHHDSVIKRLDASGYFVVNADIISARLHGRRAIPPENYEDKFTLFLLKHLNQMHKKSPQD